MLWTLPASAKASTCGLEFASATADEVRFGRKAGAVAGGKNGKVDEKLRIPGFV